MKDLGLYVHIPFCKSKCHYCDFCSFVYAETEMESYCEALLSEMREVASEYGDRPVSTVYFGGGTPTTLPIFLFSKLIKTTFEIFSIKNDAEITTECNPGTVSLEYLKALKESGINRLSIGAQSMNDRELKLLGRIHTARETAETVAHARRAGFENISLDLMMGIPEQTSESLRQSLWDICALSPEHISAYGLKIEEGTPFWSWRDTLSLPDEETERAFYMDTVAFLAEQGYGRYEISNFAKRNFESRHNLRYWRRQDYVGIGLAAHSCVGNERFFNTDSLPLYLGGKRRDCGEILAQGDILAETVMLAMRLEEGLDTDALKNDFGNEAATYYQNALSKFVPMGLVRQNGNRFAFTSDGMYVSNAILAEILEFEPKNDA